MREQFGEKLLIRVISMLGLTLAIFSSNSAIFFPSVILFLFSLVTPQFLSPPICPSTPMLSHQPTGKLWDVSRVAGRKSQRKRDAPRKENEAGRGWKRKSSSMIIASISYLLLFLMETWIRKIKDSDVAPTSPSWIPSFGGWRARIWMFLHLCCFFRVPVDLLYEWLETDKGQLTSSLTLFIALRQF